MNPIELDAAVEAVVFACGSPVSADRLCETLGVGRTELRESAARLTAQSRGISLIELDGCYQFCTKAYLAAYVKRALELRKTPPLSKASLEVLAIVAYNQPVTRSFVEAVRGVDSSYIVTSLLDKGLIAEGGQLDAPGRPTLFVTTDGFLRCFGLQSLAELPEVGLEDPQEGTETLTALAERAEAAEA